jgi:MOSC domain-containing protein YiiM
MNSSVIAVCVVHRIKHDAGIIGSTAIDKRPVDGPVQVEMLGLAGDIQCDTSRHGGRDKALYAYAEVEAQRWAAELGRPAQPGMFGENLMMRALAVTDSVIGERWQVGSEVQVEVTAPRMPCATFGRHVGQPHWVRRFSERTDVGAYLRVLRRGRISAGDPVQRLHVPKHEVTVREVFTALMNGAADPDRLRLLLAGDSLAASLRPYVERVVNRLLQG